MPSKENQAECASRYARLFDEWHENKSEEKGKLSGTAADMYRLTFFLRQFADEHVPITAANQARRASFEAACDVVQVYVKAKRGEVSIRESGADLRDKYARYLRLRKNAYGLDGLVPKHHFMFDIANQWMDYDLAEEFVLDMYIYLSEDTSV